jgi:hypothetical protein
MHALVARSGALVRWLWCGSCCLAAAGWILTPSSALAQFVPGSGQEMLNVSDDFEDPDWHYISNGPKSSKILDEKIRQPIGHAANGRWEECMLRGQPDVVERVPTPEGGLPGSLGALLLQSRDTGVPGQPSREMQQDDLQLNVAKRMGGRSLPIGIEPSAVVRVYVPPFDEWEDRSGGSFGFRAEVTGTRTKESGGFFGGSKRVTEPFWPGMFIEFQSKRNSRDKQDSARLTVRAGPRGNDIPGPRITEAGWWTLGMSFTSDGQIHYFARPGVEDLRPEDRLTSQFPYGFKVEQFNTVFFNVCSADNGRHYSTPWVIDDARFYVRHRPTQSAGTRGQGGANRR